MMKIYLDNAATTQLEPEVIELMKYIEEEAFANASGIHKPGVKAAEAIEKTRMIISDAINSSSDDIYFTSGGTEANNLAIKGLAFANWGKKNHIITSSVEHPSIDAVLNWLVRFGYEITYLPVDKEGFVNPEDLDKAITENTLLVTIMQANNEIGTIEPIEGIGKICNERGVYFHTDACQSFTKTPLDVKRMNLDLVTLNAHKIHGPKGVGALYIKNGLKLDPIFHGGGQEKNIRSGTYNTAGIAGFGKATEIGLKNDFRKMSELRDYFIDEIIRNIDGVELNGPKGEKRLPNNINLIFNKVNGKRLFLELNKKGISVSTGSACSNTKLTPSKILLALGHEPDYANGAIRITTSKWTTKEELDYVVENLTQIIKEQRANNN
jgi:cysteine desulfurase